MTTIIPYVIFDVLNDDTIIEYGSVPSDELYNSLINEIKRYMELHNFDDDFDDDFDLTCDDVEDKDLTCDECDCRVVSKKYITVIDGKKLCGSCNSNPNDNIIVNNENTSFKEIEKSLKEIYKDFLKVEDCE